ncbi:MAG: pyridoxal phosphate-dependent aminotransferase [Bacteroidales bacterium]
MTIKLSERINKMAESETIAMSRKSRELTSKGYDVINLSLGEPDFFTPEEIKTAAKDAIDENFSFYTAVNGYQELRSAISKKLKRDNQLDYSPDDIVVSTGAKQSLMNAVLCLVDPGDEVIIPVPFWVSYVQMVTLAEGKPHFLETGIAQDFKITPDQLEAAITEHTKLFLFSSPCNPSGSLYSKKELEALANVFKKYPHVYIISDEIYELINFSGNHESIAQFSDIKDRVIVINGVSKGFAMTGWRLGYMAAHPALAKAATKLQGQFTSATSSITQKAAEKAMEIKPSTEMLNKFRERRDLILDLIREIPGVKTNVPHGAFYIFPEVSYYFGKSDGKNVIKNVGDLCMYLLNNALVAVVPGNAFGTPGCVRISYATSNDLIIEAMKRIKNALELLK